MNKVIIEPLTWDSELFGYPVGKVNLSDNIYAEKQELITLLRNSKYSLIYIFTAHNQPETEKEIISLGGKKVDEKILLSKKPEEHSSFHSQIIDYLGNTPNEQLRELALVSGHLSRFKTDTEFINNEYNLLYNKWIENSVNDKKHTKVLVAKNKTDITGMITITQKTDEATIGLLAVDKMYQKMNLGSELIKKADNEACLMKCSRISVATQVKNTAAVNVYVKCGFSIDSISDVYHLRNSR
jgi:dTDP-4-amino-4,6-dideoxy-D-galactose acyltransferase